MTLPKTQRNALRRYARYMLLKLDKINGTPYAIAAGFACGAAISFTPFVGFHMLLAALTALIIRGNILASAFGTVMGNPWTFPIIWPTILFTGRLFLNDTHTGKIDFITVFKKLADGLIHFDFSMMATDIWPVLLPMMIGCIPYYIIVWALSYYLVKQAMDKFKLRKERLRRV